MGRRRSKFEGGLVSGKLRDEKRDRVDYIQIDRVYIYSMYGKLSLMMYIVTYCHSRNKRCGEGGRGGIGLGLKVRTLRGEICSTVQESFSWSSTYRVVS